jgi:hypothetical protein
MSRARAAGFGERAVPSIGHKSANKRHSQCAIAATCECPFAFISRSSRVRAIAALFAKDAIPADLHQSTCCSPPGSDSCRIRCSRGRKHPPASCLFCWKAAPATHLTQGEQISLPVACAASSPTT